MKTSKMTPSGSPQHTHPNYAVPPEQFRAQATGIGQTREASLVTGGMRAQRVVDCMPQAARAALPASSGYPEPLPDHYGMALAGRGY